MIIGLTGGIGSGKSTVAQLFSILGYAVFNSDQVAKQVYQISEIKEKVIALLGKEAYLEDNRINKHHISSKVFDQTDLLGQLNAIIHPAVIQAFRLFTEEHPQQLIIKETALLFEAKLDKEVDKIIFIDAPESLRIARVMDRDGISQEMVEKKIKSQMPEKEKVKRSDYIIHNNEKESLIEQVIKVHQQLLKFSV